MDGLWMQAIDNMKSDHRPITFEVMGEYVQNLDSFRNIRKTRWDLYKKERGSQLENMDLNSEKLG